MGWEREPAKEVGPRSREQSPAPRLGCFCLSPKRLLRGWGKQVFKRDQKGLPGIA